MSNQGIKQLIIESTKTQTKDTFTPYSFVKQPDDGNSQVISDVLEDEKKKAFDLGYKEALEKVNAEWNDKLTLISNLAESLNDPLRGVDQMIQENTANISIAIAKQIIRRELSVDSGQIVSVVKQAIELMPKDDLQINISINPKDEDKVKKLFLDNDHLSKYNIIQDPTISVGGCKAYTDYSMLDLTIDKQIATICSQILGDQRNAEK